MTTDWKEAARGIPVWEGCLEMYGGRVEAIDGPNIRKRDGLTVGYRSPATSGPDLSDPDTRSAYDRRLAIALGCPESIANRGVIVHTMDGGPWMIHAGFGWTRPLGISGDVDGILARALAWPTDKRIS